MDPKPLRHSRCIGSGGQYLRMREHIIDRPHEALNPCCFSFCGIFRAGHLKPHFQFDSSPRGELQFPARALRLTSLVADH